MRSFFKCVTAVLSVVLLLSLVASCYSGESFDDGLPDEAPVDQTPSVENVDFSNTTIAFLGDSITYGYVTKKGGQYENPYPALVENLLGAKKVYNYGVGGSTLSRGNKYYQPFIDRCLEMEEDIDIIGVMGGTNDFYKGVPLGEPTDTVETTVYGALNILAERLKERYPNAQIFFMSPLPTGDYATNALGYSTRDIRNIVLDVANKNGFGFLDMYYVSGFEKEMKTDKTDGTHPSQELLIDTIAPKIAAFIKENYK